MGIFLIRLSLELGPFSLVRTTGYLLDLEVVDMIMKVGINKCWCNTIHIFLSHCDRLVACRVVTLSGAVNHRSIITIITYNLALRSVKSVNVDFLNQIRYFSIK